MGFSILQSFFIFESVFLKNKQKQQTNKQCTKLQNTINAFVLT